MVASKSSLEEITAITAIGNSADEDFIAQLIDSQGWRIIYRAIDQVDLAEFINSSSRQSSYTLLLRSDFSGINIHNIVASLPEKAQIISLDSIQVSSHLIMSHLRNELRTPTFSWHHDSAQAPQASNRERYPVIAISGTSGSPGRSRLAISLARSFATESSVVLWDLEGSVDTLEYLWRERESAQSGESVEIRSISAGSDLRTLELPSESRNILDLGVFPKLEHLTRDRRWHPHVINHLLDRTDHLIYVVAASGVHLLRLEEFITQFPKQLRTIPITYLLTPILSSREDRAIEDRFKKLTSGERAMVLAPIDSRNRAQSMAQLLLLIDERDR